jgi:hypothetical protein
MLWRSVAVATATAAAVVWTGPAKADGDTMRLGLNVTAPTMTLGGNTDADTVEVWRRYGYRSSFYYGGYSSFYRPSYYYGYSYYRPSYYYGGYSSFYPRSYYYGGYSSFYYPRYSYGTATTALLRVRQLLPRYSYGYSYYHRSASTTPAALRR